MLNKQSMTTTVIINRHHRIRQHAQLLHTLKHNMTTTIIINCHHRISQSLLNFSTHWNKAWPPPLSSVVTTVSASPCWTSPHSETKHDHHRYHQSSPPYQPVLAELLHTLKHNVTTTIIINCHHRISQSLLNFSTHWNTMWPPPLSSIVTTVSASPCWTSPHTETKHDHHRYHQSSPPYQPVLAELLHTLKQSMTTTVIISRHHRISQSLLNFSTHWNTMWPPPLSSIVTTVSASPCWTSPHTETQCDHHHHHQLSQPYQPVLAEPLCTLK